MIPYVLFADDVVMWGLLYDWGENVINIIAIIIMTDIIIIIYLLLSLLLYILHAMVAANYITWDYIPLYYVAL